MSDPELARTPLTISPEPALQPPPVERVVAPAAETTGADPALQQAIERGGVRGSLRLLLRSGSGRVGLLLFGLMVGLSIWVVATYPRDFGVSRWSNPAVWADNPKNAPPVWTRFFGDVVPHSVQTLEAPTESRTIAAGEVRLFSLPIAAEDVGSPASLSMTLSGVTFQGRAPAILASLVRPDGGRIRLASVPIAAPRSGEVGPYRRFFDTSERVLLSSGPTPTQAISAFFAERYPGTALTLPQGDLSAALFGRPADDGLGGIVPMAGEYLLEIQTVVADPADEIAPIRVTVGGTAFGVMGTDGLGRDLWQGLLYGFPVALLIATLTAAASTLIGASLGIISGYSGGGVDATIQRFSDIVSNVPTLPLLIFLVTLLGRQLWLIMLVLVAFSWPGLTILVRSMVLQLRSGQLVESARALGASRRRIMTRHVFPQVAPFIIAQMIFFAPGAILAEASLSFLGLGDPSIPTWGQMLESGFRTGALYVGYWWWVLPPGLLIVLTAVAFMLLA
ncbi:MAG: ABC transporter permease, partial [Chloroflexia bacterium]|nr:ABC transporter permease [Chloroflexia bacterium]